MLLSNKTVVLGITGGIAAYKMPNVAHALVKLGADVHVLMTKNATEFISPLVFETLTRRRCQVDTFDRNFQYDVAHISLANAADLMLIAPATANVIAKLAHGQADDMLTTVTLAATCPKLVAPAMNTHMLENPITQDNLKTLEHYGFTVIPSGSGMLACGDVGSGRLPDEGVLVDYVLRELACAKDLKGKKVVVSAGATQEPMDPVRYLTNHSTGKMGYAVARACMLRGADVTLLASTGCTLPPVPFVKTVPFTTAADLFEAVKANAMDADALVMAAAVADYKKDYLDFTLLGEDTIPQLTQELIRAFTVKRIGYQFDVYSSLLRLFAALENPDIYKAAHISLRNSQELLTAEQVKKQIETHHGAIQRTNLAEALNYSCEHISRIIKTNTGYTLKAYCQKVQMAEAARLLRTTELPVCQIAASMGYENRTQFYKVFRREYGLTPLEYRRHIAEE